MDQEFLPGPPVHKFSYKSTRLPFPSSTSRIVSPHRHLSHQKLRAAGCSLIHGKRHGTSSMRACHLSGIRIPAVFTTGPSNIAAPALAFNLTASLAFEQGMGFEFNVNSPHSAPQASFTRVCNIFTATHFSCSRYPAILLGRHIG